MIRTYSELSLLETFEERFRYLMLKKVIGVPTFGFDRYFNQLFYNSVEWKRVRRFVIIRDQSCDLGILDRPLFSNVLVHHMNPISIEDIKNGSDMLLDPEFLISTSLKTHTAIHFSDDRILLPSTLIERRRGDTTLWKKKF